MTASTTHRLSEGAALLLITQPSSHAADPLGEWQWRNHILESRAFLPGGEAIGHEIAS
jgi:hypothetical protein